MCTLVPTFHASKCTTGPVVHFITTTIHYWEWEWDMLPWLLRFKDTWRAVEWQAKWQRWVFKQILREVGLWEFAVWKIVCSTQWMWQPRTLTVLTAQSIQLNTALS